MRWLASHRFPGPVPDHAVQADGLPVGHHVLVLRVVHVAARVAGQRLLLLLLPAGRRGFRAAVPVARLPRLVRVLALHALRVHVPVPAAGHAVRADRLLLERAVVVLETPRDAAVRVIVPVPPQHLHGTSATAASVKRVTGGGGGGGGGWGVSGTVIGVRLSVVLPAVASKPRDTFSVHRGGLARAIADWTG